METEQDDRKSKHKIHMKTYAEKNKERLAEYRKEWYLKIKNDPEKYKKYLDRQKMYSMKRNEEFSRNEDAHQEYLEKQREYKKKYILKKNKNKI